jgi:hypothetical protein
MFHGMCEQFASGYQPRDASTFVSDLVARLTGAPMTDQQED